MHYLKGRFWADLFASVVPLQLHLTSFVWSQEDSQYLTLFGLIKLMRVLRLSKIIDYLNLQEDVKVWIKLAKLVFFLIMHVHVSGCCFFFLTNLEKKWRPPLDNIYETSSFFEDSMMTQYWISFYTAVLLLTGNEVSPRTEAETFVVIGCLILGAIINGNILGNMAVLLGSMNRRATLFQEKFDTANTAMKNMFLSEELQKKVITYLMYTQSTN